MIPSSQECFRRMRQYAMLDHIRDHSVQVAKIAEFLAQQLIAAGENLSLPLTVAAALLHDIGKTQCLNTDCDHALLGRDICLAHGYTELAPIVGEHVVLKNGVPDNGLSEKEIVHYADKRVTHDTIVDLDDRLEYILERYGNNDDSRHQAIKSNFSICRRIEVMIFDRLAISPAAVAEEVEIYRSSLSEVA